MADLPLSQLQAAIAQLDQAAYNHDQWYKNLLRVLVARLPPDTADLIPDAHKRCRFGQWYDSDAVGPLREHPAFVALGQAHQQMHAGAREILQRVADDLPVAAADLDQFNNVLDRLRLELQSLRHELADAAVNRDPLTGARNRASLLIELREQQALVRRGVQVCALAMADIDHFKAINDRFGHSTGDAVLLSTSQCLLKHLRPYDRVYRFGGEEFLICMPGTTVETALIAAERLRAEVAAQQVQGGGGASVQVTASFGVAALDGSQAVEDSIDRADRAMYQAKTGGRNRVEALRE